jgi:hypothetical protein
MVGEGSAENRCASLSWKGDGGSVISTFPPQGEVFFPAPCILKMALDIKPPEKIFNPPREFPVRLPSGSYCSSFPYSKTYILLSLKISAGFNGLKKLHISST